MPTILCNISLLQQVKQLFGFCGQVKSCRMVGNNQFAFVEYSSPGVSRLSESGMLWHTPEAY